MTEIKRGCGGSSPNKSNNHIEKGISYHQNKISKTVGEINSLIITYKQAVSGFSSSI
jgi:hypothetical protein